MAGYLNLPRNSWPKFPDCMRDKVNFVMLLLKSSRSSMQ
jgi:hypothetical protein